MHTDIYGSFIHNCPDLEATKTSFSRWMDKKIVVHPVSGILFGFKKIELSSHKETGRNLKCILLSKRSQLENAT